MITREQNYIYCRNNCGAKITFSDNANAKSGKKIPLQENGLPHDCPKNPYNQYKIKNINLNLEQKVTAAQKQVIQKIDEYKLVEDFRSQIANANTKLSEYHLELVVKGKSADLI
jgi:hypothetical protein